MKALITPSKEPPWLSVASVAKEAAGAVLVVQTANHIGTAHLHIFYVHQLNANNNISFFLRLFFYLVTFVTYSVTTVIRCLESIGQAVVRVQAGHFE